MHVFVDPGLGSKDLPRWLAQSHIYPQQWILPLSAEPVSWPPFVFANLFDARASVSLTFLPSLMLMT